MFTRNGFFHSNLGGWPGLRSWTWVAPPLMLFKGGAFAQTCHAHKERRKKNLPFKMRRTRHPKFNYKTNAGRLQR